MGKIGSRHESSNLDFDIHSLSKDHYMYVSEERAYIFLLVDLVVK